MVEFSTCNQAVLRGHPSVCGGDHVWRWSSRPGEASGGIQAAPVSRQEPLQRRVRGRASRIWSLPRLRDSEQEQQYSHPRGRQVHRGARERRRRQRSVCDGGQPLPNLPLFLLWLLRVHPTMFNGRLPQPVLPATGWVCWHMHLQGHYRSEPRQPLYQLPLQLNVGRRSDVTNMLSPRLQTHCIWMFPLPIHHSVAEMPWMCHRFGDKTSRWTQRQNFKFLWQLMLLTWLDFLYNGTGSLSSALSVDAH